MALSSPKNKIKTGLYRHYKGNDYEVIGTARHSETLETLVVYKPLYNDTGIWVRPLGMFQEKLSLNGKLVSRFSYLEAKKDND